MRAGLGFRIGPVRLYQPISRGKPRSERQKRWGSQIGVWAVLTIIETYLTGDALTGGVLAIVSMVTWAMIKALTRSLRT